MNIIEPNVELWEQGTNDYKHIARCARICYDTPDNGRYEGLIKSLYKNKHLSMFRHLSIYAIAPLIEYNNFEIDFNNILYNYQKCPYINIIYDNTEIYIVTNGNFLIDLYNSKNSEDKYLYNYIIKYRVSEEQFKSTEIGFNMMRYTFKITTQISTSRELNRISPNNIAERSTRYVNEQNGCICRPHWISKEEANIYNNHIYPIYPENRTKTNYIIICKRCFINYNALLKSNIPKEDARGLLPLDTATICAYTYSIKEWRHFIDNRYYGVTGKPHPNAKIIASMIKDELVKLGYEFK